MLSSIALVLIILNLIIIFTPTSYESAYQYLTNLGANNIDEQHVAYALSIAPYDIDLWRLTAVPQQDIISALKKLPVTLTQPVKQMNMLNIILIICIFYIWRTLDSTHKPAHKTTSLTKALTNLSEKPYRSGNIFKGSKRLYAIVYLLAILLISNIINVSAELYNLSSNPLNISIIQFLNIYNYTLPKLGSVTSIPIANFILNNIQIFYVAIIFFFIGQTKIAFKKFAVAIFIFLIGALALHYSQRGINIDTIYTYLLHHQINDLLLSALTIIYILFQLKRTKYTQKYGFFSLALIVAILFPITYIIAEKTDIYAHLALNTHTALAALMIGRSYISKRSYHHLNAK